MAKNLPLVQGNIDYPAQIQTQLLRSGYWNQERSECRLPRGFLSPWSWFLGWPKFSKTGLVWHLQGDFVQES